MSEHGTVFRTAGGTCLCKHICPLLSRKVFCNSIECLKKLVNKFNDNKINEDELEEEEEEKEEKEVDC